RGRELAVGRRPRDRDRGAPPVAREPPRRGGARRIARGRRSRRGRGPVRGAVFARRGALWTGPMVVDRRSLCGGRELGGARGGGAVRFRGRPTSGRPGPAVRGR